METYTLRLFYNGQREIQEEEFKASSQTAAYNHAAGLAKQARANHFNVNLGRIDREETTAAQISRKK
jgi:hypothetical protein